MSKAHNIDAILTQPQQDVTEPVNVSATVEETKPVETPKEHDQTDEHQKKEADPYLPDVSEQKPEDSSPIDEYGNPIEKAKTYTEDDVQRIVRERLARAKYEVPPPPKETPKQPENTEEDWRAELKQEIKRTHAEIEQEKREQLWREQQLKKQAEFEDKFSRGMEKYSDFKSVVSGKPITDSMVRATMALDNPAAFIYAAAKLHPQEIERIAKIGDEHAQAFEVGKLHQMMIKEKKAAANTGKPLEVVKGDMPAKTNVMPSLEQRINDYAKSKRR